MANDDDDEIIELDFVFGNEDEREDDDGAMKQDMDEAVVTHELGVSLRSEQPPPISKKLLLLLLL